MNKLATAPAQPHEYELFGFMDKTPSGYEETGGSDPIMYQRRFLGIGWKTEWSHGNIDSNGCWWQTFTQSYTVFGFPTDTPVREVQGLKTCP
ncbi:MAG: hypothetical protein JWQ96_1554 [Segetibacter sp.]|nr:hypothetical protein [Segetibacter sp.]